MSLIKFKLDLKNKKNNYSPNVKAKLDSHLLLDDDDKITLTSLLDNKAPGVVEIQWDLSNDEHIRERNQFLHEHGLDLDSDNVKFVGYLKHSKQCTASQPQRDPTYKLLPYIKQSAKNLLNLNARTCDILAQNAKTVKNIFGGHTLIDNSRTLLTAMDIVNIRKQIIQKNWNINIKNDAAVNLEQFLGSDADSSELKEACLHYQPYMKETNRLEIIICTQEQQQYAWKYGHNNLILVDGTFGISKHKVLLFIIMVIDEKNKGISVTFILFTPPPYNQLISSGYDSKILERLFTIFQNKISETYNHNRLKENSKNTPIIFSPLVAMTDTDVKEQKSLSMVWPGITLLLCYFHISQC
ncbi:hypothetical protein C2G38_2040242 [Gigaspora rosea]|uniref:MULE transposase domain-containing protein n=1 Tax=Gigaspora rosea TaxID=44941 RepID=A0A397V378_9GLOM|nr:hypothetical protein C2G38_2040242 [Gigaspora rosea]